MTTTLDTELRAAVEELFAEFGGGVDATLIPVDGTYDPATTGAGAPSAPVAVKASPPAEFSRHLVESGQVLRGDVAIVLKGDVSPAPKAGWEITVASTTFLIVEATRLSGGDDAAAWELQCRR